MHMKTLIWKDFRNQRRFLIAAGVFLLVPHVISAASLMVNQFGTHAIIRPEWNRFFWAASMADLGIAALLTAFLAGNAIAGERMDRSAEFTAYLPIPRKNAITSKAIVAAGISVSLLAVCTSIAVLIDKLGQLQEPPPRTDDINAFVGAILMAFGTAWLASSMARSATYAAAVGIVVPICIGIMFDILGETGAMAHVHMATVYLVTGLLIGPGCFVAGVVCYLRRVEP